MKKFLLVSLMITLLVCLFTVVVGAQETTVEDADFVGGIIYKSTTNEFGTVNTAADTSTVYYYTSTLDTTSRMVLKNADGTYSTYPTIYVMYTVTDSQGPRWGFEKLNEITGEAYDVSSVARIEFPEGTNHVRGSSFKNNTELVYVKIASTINQIKGNAFEGCSNLSKIEFNLNFEKYPEFGSNLKSINNGSVFKNCTSLTELILPNSVTEVNTGAISGCTNLKVFNPGASFTKTNNQPIGAPTESFILSDTYQGNCMLFSYDRISKPNRPTTLVFYYTGTLAQAQNLQEIETQCYEIKYGTLVSYDEFTSSTFVRDTSLHYFVYGYNYCDAFFGGNHEIEAVNNCVSTCSVCDDTIIKHNDLNAEAVTLTYDKGFLNIGVHKVVCSNEGCGYDVTVEAPAIFVCSGYSTPENGKCGLAISFTVNKNALADYEAINSESLKYGAFAVAYNNIGENDILSMNNAVMAEIDREYGSFEMKLTGFETEAQMNAKLTIGAYVIDKSGKVTYLQPGTPLEGDKYCYVSYNSIVNQ